MRIFDARSVFLLLFLLSLPSGLVAAGEKPGKVKATSATVQVPATLGYDSDSEDEGEGDDKTVYTYPGLASLTLSEEHMVGVSCIAVSRGIHCSPSKFTKEQRSHLRRDAGVGEPLFSAAACFMADSHRKRSREDAVVEALKIRGKIKGLSEKDRATFQQKYTNSYDGFPKALEKGDPPFDGFESLENPQVSTSENYLHSAKYAAGLKFLGKDVTFLRPEYDATGRPKHPYLGKIYLALIPTVALARLAPYFVAWGHANKHISVSTHFSNDILTEREVSFPGYIPGRYVVFSVNVRVPNFSHVWQAWHEKKYGMNKRSYNTRKTKVIARNLKKEKEEADEDFQERKAIAKEKAAKSLIKHLIAYYERQLQEYVEVVCQENGIELCYKSLDDGYGVALPEYDEVVKRHKS